MTLARLTERIQEEKEKKGKVDGRRFNSRSRTKMYWEIRNIEKSIKIMERNRKTSGRGRTVFTTDELQEYKKVKEEMREKKAVVVEGKEPKLKE
ncbi:unknown [Feldmannia species virus]|uniref:Uncharacterized protein n=1 Tax=Feldmannia species virus TaxID=39420 RepID=B5LWI6_9PHYC|nr:hypothetical protein FeldSpV_gp097 [Feldmannia species virus]ACH46849.1 unknown [Feldmannia species virus]